MDDIQKNISLDLIELAVFAKFKKERKKDAEGSFGCVLLHASEDDDVQTIFFGTKYDLASAYVSAALDLIEKNYTENQKDLCLEFAELFSEQANLYE